MHLQCIVKLQSSRTVNLIKRNKLTYLDLSDQGNYIIVLEYLIEEWFNKQDCTKSCLQAKILQFLSYPRCETLLKQPVYESF